jgi:hypothetical protein
MVMKVVCFLPWHVVAHVQEVNCIHWNFTQVSELYDSNEVGIVRKNKSIWNHGMASYCLQDDVLEGYFFNTKLK